MGIIDRSTYEPDPEFEELKKDWYNNVTVKFEIVKNLVYRETAVINVTSSKRTLRCLKINAVKYLDLNNERYQLFDDTFNIYGSLAKFPQLPMFSFSHVVKNNQQQKFNNEYKSLISSYDMLIDIDNPDIPHALDTVRKVKIIFDKYKVPYWIQFSGSKGFHIRVDYDDYPEWLKQKSWDDISMTLKHFAENFKLVNNLNDLDLGVFDLRRIAKTPYTVVYPYYLVALPLTDEQLDNFNIEIVSLPYLMKHISTVYNRGVLKRDGTKEGLHRLFKDYLEM